MRPFKEIAKDIPLVIEATRVQDAKLPGHVRIWIGEYTAIHKEDEQTDPGSDCSSCTFYLPGQGWVRVVFANDSVEAPS